MKLVVSAWGFHPPVTPPPVRSELVEAGACSLIGLHACAKGGCRDVRPAAHLLFLRRQEKKAKEGDPTVCVPALRFGQPAVLASSGVSLELAALRQSRALIRWPLRSSAHTEGRGRRTAEQPFGPLLRSALGRQLAVNVAWAFSTHLVRFATRSFWLKEQLSSENKALDSRRSSRFSSTSL